MNILHVISSVFRNGGGTSEVVPRLCRAQTELGNSVTLAVIDSGAVSDSAEEAVRSGVNLLQFPPSRYIPIVRFSSTMRRAMPRLVSDADIVHLHGLWQAPCWYAAAECRRQRKPYVMMPHGFLEPERLKISKLKKRIVGDLVERRNLRNAAAIITTSDKETLGVRAYGLKNPVSVMPIGLDVDRYTCTHKYRKSNGATGKKRLLYFSRITPIKGLDMLAEAWGRLDGFHDKWELLIVGPDDRGYSRIIQSEFERLSPDGSVRFGGAVFGEEKYRLLSSADAFVLPTRNENWGIAAAEAMASGLPVVCTKGAPWHCIEECGCGYWVDISVDGLCYGLSKIMAATDDEQNRMGRKGREWVAVHLNWQNIASEMVSVYGNILENNR